MRLSGTATTRPLGAWLSSTTEQIFRRSIGSSSRHASTTVAAACRPSVPNPRKLLSADRARAQSSSSLFAGCGSSSFPSPLFSWQRQWFSSEAVASPNDSFSPSAMATRMRRKHLRAVAIIAHVDHGKTTLVDELLKAAERSRRASAAAAAAAGAGGGAAADNNEADAAVDLNRLMDSGELEKERGITITSKVTRLEYCLPDDNDNKYILNIVDTPGHSDFCGEVDRVLSMVDGVCLVVDAAEGPMTQTKYVLSRAIALGLKPVVVLNKCDRPDALQRLDSGETESALADLFDALGASDEAKNHVTMYASARKGWIVEEDPFQAMELAQEDTTHAVRKEFGMEGLIQVLINEIPEPAVQYYQNKHVNEEESQDGEFFADDKFSLAAVTVGFDKYLGRTCTGRIVSGSVKTGDIVQVLPRMQEGAPLGSEPTTVSGVFVFSGVERKPYEQRAYAGDCVTLTGVPEWIAVGDTLTSASDPVPLPIETPPLAPPTLSMDFGANNGPLAGKEGTMIASSKIRDRLVAESDNNVTLKVEKSETDTEKTIVYARGELQLGILVEQMRREGFEFIISPPRILTYTDEATNKLMEPFEEVVVDVDSEYAGMIVSALTGDRKGTLVEMSETAADGKSRLVLEVPSRGLLGFASEVATTTRGSAVVNHYFLEDREYVGRLGHSLYKSKLVSNSAGKATSHALSSLAARGTLFISPGEEVYPGMVIGESTKTGPDLEVNAVRQKEVTNMRTQSKDEKVQMAPPKRMTFEELVGYMSEDEMIEVTPKSIRLRKALLDNSARERAARDKSRSMKASSSK